MSFDDYFALAVKKLRRYSYSQVEIKQYLQKEGASSTEAEEVVTRLLELSYLDDLALAQDIYRSCRRGKPCGQLLWSEKLKQRGIPKEVIQQLVAENNREEEVALATQLAEEYLQTKSNKTYDQQYRGLYSYLMRRGFMVEIVEQVFREMYDNC